VRVGIVGAGLQANRRLAALAPEDRLVALYSQRDRRAEALIERYGGEAVDNWQDLVARKDLDAVIVASPPRSHREIVVAALEAGKHVLCEKPLAASSEEATVMAEAAARRGRILICGFNHRFHPAITAARELLETGIHGRVLALDAAYGHGLRGGVCRRVAVRPGAGIWGAVDGAGHPPSGFSRVSGVARRRRGCPARPPLRPAGHALRMTRACCLPCVRV